MTSSSYGIGEAIGGIALLCLLGVISRGSEVASVAVIVVACLGTVVLYPERLARVVEALRWRGGPPTGPPPVRRSG